MIYTNKACPVPVVYKFEFFLLILRHGCLQRHVLESRRVCSIKAIIAIRFPTCIAPRRADIPRGFPRSIADKGHVLPFAILGFIVGFLCAGFRISISVIHAISQINRRVVFNVRQRFSNCLIGVLLRAIAGTVVAFRRVDIDLTASRRVLRQCHDRQHADQHDQRQQAG